MSKKIVVIGAGSAEFGMDALAGIFRTEGLHGHELALVDIDRYKLDQVKKLAHRMNREWGADMVVTSSTERKLVMQDADFVVLSIAVDRENTWKQDHELGRKYGITHYAENGGPGAFAHTCRNLGIILPILKDIEHLCPKAHMITFTNPLSRICTAIHQTSQIFNVGLCDGVRIGYFILATIMHEELGITLKKDPRFLWNDEHVEFFEDYQVRAMERYDIQAAGINHFTWMYSIKDKQSGEEIYPQVKELIKKLPAGFEPFTQMMFRLFGMIPVTGDTHISEYVPYASNLYEGTWERYDIQLYDFEWSRQRRARTVKYIGELAEGKGSLDPFRDGSLSERCEHIMDAMINDKPSYEQGVNIPNRAYIPNLPENAIVEVPATVDARGISGMKMPPLPEAIAAICQRQLSIYNMNVEAFIKADRQLVYQMFAIDPMIQDSKVAIQLADEYIETYKIYLPEF